MMRIIVDGPVQSDISGLVICVMRAKQQDVRLASTWVHARIQQMHNALNAAINLYTPCTQRRAYSCSKTPVDGLAMLDTFSWALTVAYAIPRFALQDYIEGLVWNFGMDSVLHARTNPSKQYSRQQAYHMIKIIVHGLVGLDTFSREYLAISATIHYAQQGSIDNYAHIYLTVCACLACISQRRRFISLSVNGSVVQVISDQAKNA